MIQVNAFYATYGFLKSTNSLSYRFFFLFLSPCTLKYIIVTYMQFQLLFMNIMPIHNIFLKMQWIYKYTLASLSLIKEKSEE